MTRELWQLQKVLSFDGWEKLFQNLDFWFFIFVNNLESSECNSINAMPSECMIMILFSGWVVGEVQDFSLEIGGKGLMWGWI